MKSEIAKPGTLRRGCFLLTLAGIILLAGCSFDPKVKRDKYYNSAQQYLAQGRYDEAAIQFRNALQIDKEHVPSHLGLAKTLQNLGAHQDAYNIYQLVVKLDDKNVEARIQLGDYLVSAGAKDPSLYQKAQEMAEEVLHVDPSNVEALIIQANAYAASNDVDKAIEKLEKALSLDSDNRKASLALGIAQFRKKDVQKAEQIFKGILEKHPDYAQAHLAMADLCAATQRAQEAEGYLKKAFDLLPSDPTCLYPLVNFYLSNKRVVDAENVFEEAITRQPRAREPRWGLATFYFQNGSVDKGTDALHELLKVNPGDRLAELRLAEIYLNQKDVVKADQYVSSLLARNNNDAEAHYLQGKLQLSRGEADKALTEFESAIKLNDSLLQPYVEKANLLLARGDLDAAQTALNTALQHDRTNPIIRGLLAKVLALRQQTKDALQLAEDVLGAMPNNPDAIAARGQALHSLGKLAEAKKDFQRLCELQPNNPVNWHRLGLVEVEQGDSTSGMTHFLKALDLKPDLLPAINDLLFSYIQAKRFDEALAELEKLSKKSVPQDQIHKFRGRVYLAKGDLASGEREFREAIKVSPKDYEAYILLGQLKIVQNNLPQAVKEVDQLIAVNSRSAPAFFLKGFCLAASGDVQGGITNYRKALELDPENAAAENNLAWLLCEGNINLAEALSLARQAKKRAPDDPAIADTLGWIYYKMKNYTLAVDQLLFSVNNRRQPAAEHYYRLGMAYYAKGDKMHAQETLRKSLELNPSLPDAAEVRKILKLVG